MGYALLQVLLALAASPFLLSIIRKVKAFFGGRNGPPLLQPYYDLYKLLRKDALYSRTTSWIFRAAPPVEAAAVLAALLVTPLAGLPAPVSFSGDFLFLAYVLGLMRFFTVLAALDTGSAFEGMGASREVQFSALAEVALLAGLAALAAHFESASLSEISGKAWHVDFTSGKEAALLLVSSALFMVLLAENCRVPFDDPTTHLELTMIHEVMILDHGGVDLAFIEYAASVKLWVFSSLLVCMALPLRFDNPAANLAAGLTGVFAVAVVVGVVESIMARLRLIKIPQLLVVACVLSFLAVGIGMR